MQRVIEAPGKDLLSARDCAGWLNIGVTTFAKLWHDGKFPPPIALGEKRALRWHWFDVLAWAHLRLRQGETEPLPGAAASGGGGTARRRAGAD
jgi:predicted DNA-binding transcriptional regulator AlpA